MPEQKAKVQSELKRRERVRLAQATFGWQEILDRRDVEQIAEHFFATFFPADVRRVPAPFITWDVSHATSATFSLEQQAYIDDLHRKSLSAMKRASSDSEWLVLENVNHPWYRIDLDSTPDHIEQWPVHLLPWADPCYMVAHDFSCGFIADTDRTISVFGQPLLDAIRLNTPNVFTRVVDSA